MVLQLSFDFDLSLKEIALRKVAINLWNDPNILGSIERFVSLTVLHNEHIEVNPRSIEGILKDKVSNLCIPKRLLEQMLPILTPIGLQIRMWKEFHGDYFTRPSEDFNASILARLCWADSGYIDYKKTAEELIRHNLLHIQNSFKMACLYCLDNYIRDLWEVLPGEIKSRFYLPHISQFKNTRLEFCWPYIIKGDENLLITVFYEKYRMTLELNQYLFMNAATSGNIAATVYFYEKLSDEERDASFLIKVFRFLLAVQYSGGYGYCVTNFPSNCIAGVLLFLLSQVKVETQLELLQINACKIVACFLDWPWQELFVKNLDQMFKVFAFTPAGMENILRIMNRQFRRAKNYFPHVFQQFFVCLPLNLRQVFVDRECKSGEFCPKFFQIQDTETIEVIFTHIEPKDRIRLVTSETFLKLFHDLIWRDRWLMVDACIKVAVQTNEHSDELRLAFLEYLKKTDQRRLSQNCTMKFLQLLDNVSVYRPRKRIRLA